MKKNFTKKVDMETASRKPKISHPVLMDIYTGHSQDYTDEAGTAIGAVRVLENLLNNYRLPSSSSVILAIAKHFSPTEKVVLDDEAIDAFLHAKEHFREVSRGVSAAGKKLYSRIPPAEDALMALETANSSMIAPMLESLAVSYVLMFITSNPSNEMILQRTAAKIIRCYIGLDDWELVTNIFEIVQALYNHERSCGNDCSEFLVPFEALV